MPQYNNAQMRNWFIEFFTDEEDLDFFIEDNFEEVFEQFEAGMSLKKKARLLTKHCEDNASYDQLLTLLNQENPSRYKEWPPPEPLAEESEPQATSSAQPVHDAPPADLPAQPQTAPSPATDDGPTKTPQGQDIFISYSRRDLEFVTQLHQQLTAQGISAWFDKENIHVADHWRTSIVEGIRDCKVFVLVLSPDSTASVNVRKEVDLAERYKKQIVPLMWRKTEIPVAMEYQLAGIQWIDFQQTASQENFNEFADVLRGLIGGATLAEAAGDKQVVKESTIDADVLEKVKEELKPKIGGKPSIGLIKKKLAVSPMAVGGAVISSVVTTFGLEAETQDFVNKELKWLFSATSNFLQIRRGEADRRFRCPPPARPGCRTAAAPRPLR